MAVCHAHKTNKTLKIYPDIQHSALTVVVVAQCRAKETSEDSAANEKISLRVCIANKLGWLDYAAEDKRVLISYDGAT